MERRLYRIDSTAVEKLGLCNFGYENDLDQECYGFFDRGIHPQEHLEKLKAILGKKDQQHTDCQEMERRYHHILCDRYERYKERMELEMVLRALDYKMSVFLRFIQETLIEEKNALMLEVFSEYCTRAGVTSNHRFICRQEES